MKRRFFCIVFVLIYIFTICGCGNDSVNTKVSDTANSSVLSDTQSSTESSTTVTEDLSKYLVKGFVYNGFDKYSTLSSFDVTDTVYNISMAKNEHESVQISFVAEKDFEKVGFIGEGESEGITVTKYLEHYVPCGDESYPDPLVEYKGEDVSVKKGDLLTFFIEFEADQTAKAGESEFKFYLLGDIGNLSNTVSVKVRVWDFAFPEGFTCRSYIGLNKQYLSQYTKMDTETAYVEYYETLLEHGLSPQHLPYDILDARADAYMSDPRVTSFYVPSSTDVADSKIVEYYNKLKTNPEWFKKAYFYPLDEPKNLDELKRHQARCLHLLTLCPEIKIVCPYYTNIDVSEYSDQTEFLSQYVSILCPKPCMWNHEEFYSAEQLEKYAPFKTRMNEYLANGNELWWYVCNMPGEPYLNLFVDEKGLNHRVLFWQQYRYGVSGFLYWSANYWKTADNPWTDVDTKTLSYPVYGDGILLYPGDEVNVDGAVVSLRLKAVRDGMEDYELFSLAEKVLGRNYILEKLNSVSPDVTKVSVDSKEFCKIRIEIGNDIEKAMK